ncbi:MAG: type II toxin-antitoxin system HicA family toxin [Acidobacteria bacterium]|nr:type II toxin-antitoxin system HicA family toxin [Acidobacteriota bacterium]
MKLPRDLSGADLIAALKRLGYRQTRQTGSHVRMTFFGPPQAHITVPLLRPLPTGALASLLKQVASQLEMPLDEVFREIR